MEKDNRNEAKRLHRYEKAFSKITDLNGVPFKEDEDNEYFAQFTVTKKPDKKIKLIRFLLILMYLILSVAYCVLFLVVVKIPYVVAILPGLVIVMWFFTWKYTNIDYSYIAQKDMFYVFKINGYGKAKEVFKAKISQTLSIVPANDSFKEDIADITIDEYLDFSSYPECEDKYIGIWNTDGKNTGVYFDASGKLLKLLKYFAKDKVVVTYVSR